MFDRAFAILANRFADKSGSPFVTAEAVWQGTPSTDAGGSIVSPGTPERHAVTVQFDSTTQAMRAAEGFLETDVRILVLANDLPRPMDTRAKVIVADGRHAGTWEVLSAQSDPVGIGWDCRGRRAA